MSGIAHDTLLLTLPSGVRGGLRQQMKRSSGPFQAPNARSASEGPVKPLQAVWGGGVEPAVIHSTPPKTVPKTVMARFMRAIHVFLLDVRKDVDGQDKPGHDDPFWALAS
ncbi:MAG: hypothetical protein H5U13_05685 [Parvibaculum sp.]|nr:hypothetical protein [Parvibaculum sp.]